MAHEIFSTKCMTILQIVLIDEINIKPIENIKMDEHSLESDPHKI